MATHGGVDSRGIKLTCINDVKIYNICGQRSTAPWQTPNRHRKEKDSQRGVELIQDLRMPNITNKIEETPDGNYVIATGVYPPQVRVYDLKEHSMKFQRNLNSEIVNFKILQEDYSKIAFLCFDRSVCLHAKYGSHYTLRIPRMGRDMAYDSSCCDLLLAASCPDVFRLNLHQGRFLPPLTTQSPAVNVVVRSAIHGIIACGGEDGAIECFDPRDKSSAGRINTNGYSLDSDHEVTALQFDDSLGFMLAAGTSTGKIFLYDLRMSHPLRIKDHMYDNKILSIKWHQSINCTEPKLVSADSHVVRIWDPNTGDSFTSIEPNGDVLNDFCLIRETGVMLLALDKAPILTYFVPALGPAPKWCSYLENLIEEVEDNPEASIYDDYKFLTKEEIQRLQLDNLIGTKFLRAYMHGFFIDYRLYKKAKDLIDPFSYETYVENVKKEKIEKDRASRITVRQKLPKVNRVLASRLVEKEMEEKVDSEAEAVEVKKKKKNKGLNSDILKDDRFKQLFENKDFEIDEQSAEYLAYHPQSSNKRPSLIDEHFEPVTGDEFLHDSADSDMSEDPDSEDSDLETKSTENRTKMRLYEVKDERHAEAFRDHVSLAEEDALTMGERIAAMEAKKSDNSARNVKFGPGGSREVSFITGRSKRQKDPETETNAVKRRAINSLGLKPGKAEFYAMGGGGRSSRRGGKGKAGRGRR